VTDAGGTVHAANSPVLAVNNSPQASAADRITFRRDSETGLSSQTIYQQSFPEKAGASFPGRSRLARMLRLEGYTDNGHAKR
jgi:hypothetical protein